MSGHGPLGPAEASDEEGVKHRSTATISRTIRNTAPLSHQPGSIPPFPPQSCYPGIRSCALGQQPRGEVAERRSLETLRQPRLAPVQGRADDDIATWRHNPRRSSRDSFASHQRRGDHRLTAKVINPTTPWRHPAISAPACTEASSGCISSVLGPNQGPSENAQLGPRQPQLSKRGLAMQ